MFSPYLFLIVKFHSVAIIGKPFKNNENLSETSGASRLDLLPVQSVCSSKYAYSCVLLSDWLVVRVRVLCETSASRWEV